MKKHLKKILATAIGVSALSFALNYSNISSYLNVPFIPTAQAQSDVSVDAKIRKAIEAKLGKAAKVDSIQLAPIAGLYEVRIGTDIVYVDETAEFLLLGQIQNLKTGTNYTQDRIDALSTGAVFSAESKANALKLVKGDGSREVAVFEDTNCGYCKKLRTELEKLNNVTIYTYLVPILSADSEVKMRGVWCAKDQNKAYDDWMLRGVVPPAADERCQVPVQANQLLAQNLRVRGTPALFFSNGKRVPGYIKAEQIEQELNAIK
jgi:thiol:disulfide interchange protein DsbC